MNKKKYIFLIIILILFSIGVSKVAFAGEANMNFDNFGNASGPLDEATKDAMAIGLRVVRIVAAGVAIIVLLSIGIKYMYASPEGRASYKKTFLIYVVGLLLVVSGTELIEAIADIIK